MLVVLLGFLGLTAANALLMITRALVLGICAAAIGCALFSNWSCFRLAALILAALEWSSEWIHSAFKFGWSKGTNFPLEAWLTQGLQISAGALLFFGLFVSASEAPVTWQRTLVTVLVLVLLNIYGTISISRISRRYQLALHQVLVHGRGFW